MAATIIEFKPTSKSNFQFQATFDAANYNCIINWNLFGQRYYLNIYTLRGVRILTLPLISSPLDYDISITAGYFTTKLVYRGQTNRIEVGG